MKTSKQSQKLWKYKDNSVFIATMAVKESLLLCGCHSYSQMRIKVLTLQIA